MTENEPQKMNWRSRCDVSSRSLSACWARRTRAAGLGLALGLIFGASGLLALSSPATALSAATVYRNASTSVVLIFGFTESGAGSSGTGSIVTSDGLILTNNHVISNGESGRLFPNLVVYLKPRPISGDNQKDLKTPYLVDVVARDAALDLALLRIKDAPPGLRPIEIGDSEEVNIGEPVAAIGHPGGGGLWTLTTGTVSSKRKDASRDIFQTDTAINPGNSGGPLLDEHARLIGVNTFVRRMNDQGLPLEGLNYSLRSSFALDWLNRQGVSRVKAVSRASVSTRPVAPAPAPAPTPRANTQKAQPDPKPTNPMQPMQPEKGSMTKSLAPAPQTIRKPQAIHEPQAPPADPGARSFAGPDGESMFGVPNPKIDLDEVLVHARSAYRDLIERADRSVDELDRLIDDYDNF